jgi:hypothetical protein
MWLEWCSSAASVTASLQSVAGTRFAAAACREERSCRKQLEQLPTFSVCVHEELLLGCICSKAPVLHALMVCEDMPRWGFLCLFLPSVAGNANAPPISMQVPFTAAVGA